MQLFPEVGEQAVRADVLRSVREPSCGQARYPSVRMARVRPARSFRFPSEGGAFTFFPNGEERGCRSYDNERRTSGAHRRTAGDSVESLHDVLLCPTRPVDGLRGDISLG